VLMAGFTCRENVKQEVEKDGVNRSGEG
jgi:hypothetical protein